MTRRRWIADEVSGDRAALTGTHAAHLVRVLRATVGQEFDIVAGDAVRQGRVVAVDPAGERVEFDLGPEVPAQEIARVVLLLSVFKFDRFEWAIEKCTELGVAEIVPVIARRTESHLARAAEKRVERWSRIVVQAAEQSRRSFVPKVENPAKLNGRLLADFDSPGIVLAESESERTLKDVIAERPSGGILLAVGPEGGWTEDELQMFSSNGWISVSLGATILRAETAAIAALAIAMSELQG